MIMHEGFSENTPGAIRSRRDQLPLVYHQIFARIFG
jgi:hypothetical protein